MYLIIDNKPYAILNDKIFEVEIVDGELVIGDEAKDVKSDNKEYTYDEISRKFNLTYQRAMLGEPTQELVDELNKKIDKLTKENDELKATIEELNSEKEAVNEEEIVEEQELVDEEQEETPVEENTTEEEVVDNQEEEIVEDNKDNKKKN